MCRSTNGVSRKHGEVSRALWQKLWPAETVDRVPITYVTNGVHAPTWVAPLLRSLFEKHIGTDWQQKMAEFAQKRDVFRGNRQDIYNFIAPLAGMGQGAATTTGNYGANFGNQAGGNIIGAGNATAAGTIASGNAWRQGIANSINNAVDIYGRPRHSLTAVGRV